MIKAVLFDLDGVLVDADKWHFNALNVALQLSEIDPISWQEHLTIYKGIPTRVKLEILTERRGLKQELWSSISTEKQNCTIDIIKRFCTKDPEKVEMMRLLKRRFKIAVCSNAKRETVDLMLEKSGLAPFVDLTIGNEEIAEPKPAPDIYHKAFKTLNLKPEECVIVEDSDVGRRAAMASGGVLCSVDGPHQVNYYRVLATVQRYERPNIVIPAAGQGKRFSEVGYQHPKPLIDVLGRPMIDWVMDNFSNLGKQIVILQKKHVEAYAADEVICNLHPGSEVVLTDGLTEGAACTVLLSKPLIDNDSELLIANSDQYLDIDLKSFIERARLLDVDGAILTFQSDHPKWSYAKLNDQGYVSEVAEKVVISPHATVGIYYFRKGSDFVKAAEQMIHKNIRVNNEFYVAPVFNELIQMGKSVTIHEIKTEQMHGLGTPEDLASFLNVKKQTQILEIDVSVDSKNFTSPSALTAVRKSNDDTNIASRA